jgi:hypothetical protein
MVLLEKEEVHRVAEELGTGVEVNELNGATIFEHPLERTFLAEVCRETGSVTVVLEVAFADELKLKGAELQEEALELLGSRIGELEQRGYDVKEIRQKEGHDAGREKARRIPVVDVYMERRVASVEELQGELESLIYELQTKQRGAEGSPEGTQN